MEQQRKNFPQMEEEIVKYWKENKIFEKSIAQREGQPDFVFYDGPPFATGLPHHGHILASTSKDLMGRYKSMRGYRVLRRWGWDCHGLPVENLIEKELGISGRKEIEAFGIDKFNNACEASVLKYEHEWADTVDRIGRFVDFKNSYMTMSNDFMESVWWGFKQLFEKNLIYRDTRISLYCPRCETPLSNSEIQMDNSYKMVTDPSIYVKFKLKNEEGSSLLVWTTTPWTLPANSAIAVNPHIPYLKVLLNETGEHVYLAQPAYLRMQEWLGDHKIVKEVQGEDMIGWDYEPLFNYFELEKKAYFVVAGDFVTTEDGSGLVHIAPTFGEEDYQLGKQLDLAFIETVDSQAKFLPQVTQWAGKGVWNANPHIIEYLEAQGSVFKVVHIKHEYPYCWRCDTKLIYKTQLAWYVKVSALKQRMIELNEDIAWHPDNLKHGRFGKGLESAPDWNISRSRYWGNAIPIWVCDACGDLNVIGSIAELEEKSSKKAIQLHRPTIDEHTWACECGKGRYTRTTEVFDCWFESGSMPWASVHYPFENKEYFEANYPAEFISEYVAQTRGWFYNLHVLATAIFDKPSFVHAVTTGTIVGKDGQKLSKSKKNFTDPMELVSKYGVDSMRYYLMASPLMNAENLSYKDEDQEDALRKIIMLTWNVYTFFATYADKVTSKELIESTNVLDQWILSRLHSTIQELTTLFDTYEISRGTRLIGSFIDELSTWYVRRSRDRFKDDDKPEDQQFALSTLRYVLLELSKLMAPITPFIAEDLYRSLGGGKESVHLEDWTEFNPMMIKNQVLTDMDTARGVIEKALAIRSVSGVKIRQALGTLMITNKQLSEPYFAILQDEINIKNVVVVDELPSESDMIKINADDRFKVALDLTITPELKLEGNFRELTRHINGMRKEMGLTPNDQIVVYFIPEGQEMIKTMEVYGSELKKAVRATELKEEKGNLEGKELKVNDGMIWVAIEKI